MRTPDISTKQKQQLKAKAHTLKPIVIIGAQGLTKNVHTEIESGLLAHELIKIKIAGADKESIKELIEEICRQHQAAHIQTLGHIITLFRQFSQE